MITTKDILEIEASSHLGCIAAEITALKEAGDLTDQRLRATLRAIHEHCEAVKDVCLALGSLEAQEYLAKLDAENTPEHLEARS